MVGLGCGKCTFDGGVTGDGVGSGFATPDGAWPSNKRAKLSPSTVSCWIK